VDEFIGAIALFAGNVVPKGWYPCDGRLLSVQQNSALFSLLGTSYGGDGTTNFGLPDLRGRAILGSGPNYINGAIGGNEVVALTSQQVPTHNHSVAVSNQTGNAAVVAGSVIAATSTTANLPSPPAIYGPSNSGAPAAMGPATIGPSTGNQAHNNMQPFVAMNYCICANGVYPSRP
jgi:microcystin-dependent protein